MSNNLAVSENTTFETALRLLTYKELTMASVARKCGVDTSQVLRVLNGEIRSGKVREKVLRVCERLVLAYEKKHNISIGGGN